MKITLIALTLSLAACQRPPVADTRVYYDSMNGKSHSITEPSLSHTDDRYLSEIREAQYEGAIGSLNGLSEGFDYLPKDHKMTVAEVLSVISATRDAIQKEKDRK